MRIITGSAKGTKLKAPRGMETRPTADRVKESVFNIIGPAVVEARVLDVFAGTGNLGLEALSRGAAHALFIDQSSESVKVIKENAIHTKLAEKMELMKQEAARALLKLAHSGKVFDLIFCDPPYNRGLVEETLKKIDAGVLLAENGMIILEHSQHEIVTSCWNTFVVKRTERYGETRITFLQYHQNR